jgi:alpha-beta hydrolase superfamily lysophospholipase
MEMNVEMKFTTLPNDFKCYYQHWIPSDPRALIVMVHGLGDHVGRYNELVSFLSCKGYACALYDQRGHGQSEGKRGHVKEFGQWVDDLANFFDFSEERLAPDTPIFMMGGSLGVLVILNFLMTSRKRVAGIVSASGAIGAAVKLPEWQKKLVRKASKILPSLTVDNRLAWESITRDPDELAAVMSDKLFHRRVSLSAAVEIERKLALIMGIPYRINIPALFLVGSNDPICDPHATRMFVDRLASMDKRFICYDGMLHDIIHDIGRKRVMEDIGNWLDAHTNTGRVQ